MPTKTFALAVNEPAHLTVTWKRGWKSTQVDLAGTRVLEFPTEKDLKAGGDAALPDGRALHAQLITSFFGAHMELLVDGQPVPGSATDPSTQLKTACGVIFFVAGISAGLGLLAAVAGIGFLKSMGLGWGSVVVGAIYGILGYFALKQRSRVALGAAMLLFTLDTIALFIPSGPTYNPPVSAVVTRIFFLVMMAKGFPAIAKLRKPFPSQFGQTAAPVDP